MNATASHLFDHLAHLIQGDIRYSRLDRYMVATDASIFEKIPAAVVYPKSVQDVVETVRFAGSHHLSIHPRGAGSGLCGSAIGDGVVIDFTRHMNRLISLDLDRRTFECEPGYRWGELSQVLKGSGLFFPPDPSSGEYASFGGMYATNASGSHSVKYGNVADYIEDAQLVLATGKIITLLSISRTPLAQLKEPFNFLADLYQNNVKLIETAYPDVRYNVAGYNLKTLIKEGHLYLNKFFSGTEGTLGVVTRLTFRLHPKPTHDSLVVGYFDHIGKAARAVNAVLPMNPAGIEIMDKSLLELARASDPLLSDKIPDSLDNLLMIEFDGDNSALTQALGEQAQDLIVNQGLTPTAYLAVSAEEKQKFWRVRTAAVPILYRLKGPKKILALIEDAAVPTDQLERYFQGLYAILEHHQVRFVLYGHIAKGLIHTRPLLNLKDPADIALVQVLSDQVFELVHGLGGVVSGEHGDGRLRSTYIARQYPQIYPLFQKVKKIFDPKRLLNPDIKTAVSSDHIARHLRFGEGYRQIGHFTPQLFFEDDFFNEIEKCHGCSKCTTLTTATRMCPIYKFTRKESATPKAKANILRALISGVIATDTLFEGVFQRIIDQCVSCQSCKVECPSKVDIPRLALEARSRFVARKGAPWPHHLVTRVERMGRVMTQMGILKVFFEKMMATRFMGHVNEKFTGISHERPFVSFAKKNLWDLAPLSDNTLKSESKQIRVLYFTGCYAGYIKPEIGNALLSVLRKLNIVVIMPDQFCCGLPLMTKGMVQQARQKINANLSKWYHLLNQVDHIVVTCSSCGLALMQEWQVLLNDRRLKKIKAKIIHASRLISQHLNECNLKNRPAALPQGYPETMRFGIEQDRKSCASNLKGAKMRDHCDRKKDPVDSWHLAYHMPCHLKVQPRAASSIELLSSLPGVDLNVLESHCCGMAGTWGMMTANYPLSRTMGSHLMSLLDSKTTQGVVTD